MAEVVYGGNAAVQALLYGDVHPGTQQYFESQRGSALSGLTQTARRFVEQAVDRFGFMASDRTQRIIRGVRRAADWVFHGDYIRPLRTIEELQDASPIMQRYIMAEPVVRQMFHRQQLAGYDGKYVDMQPNAEGEAVLEYRQVMQDLVVVDEDAEGQPTGWHADHWTDDVLPDEEPLDFDRQLDLLKTWAYVRQAIADRHKDPTSLHGATLD